MFDELRSSQNGNDFTAGPALRFINIVNGIIHPTILTESKEVTTQNKVHEIHAPAAR